MIFKNNHRKEVIGLSNFTQDQMLKMAEEDKKHASTMTVFYSRNTGKIYDVVSGVQDFTMYGNDAEDKKSFLVKVELPRDDFFIDTFYNYQVNLESNIIELKPSEIPTLNISLPR